MPADTPANHENRIKVFISYSHDSESHIESVRALANRLVEDEGIDVKLDLWEPAPEHGWPDWMLDGIESADFVLVVCTQIYYQRARKKEKEGIGKGVKWESLLTAAHIYHNDSTNKKFIPVFLTDENSKFIPEWLRPFTYYNLKDDIQYDDLCRHLTKQPQFIRPKLGKGRVLPPKGQPSNTSANKPEQKVDLSAMPTSSGIIVGRESEVEWLNKAWDNPKNRVVSVIAWGGVGKSSLINHWLNDMGENDFKGAARVFAHSFYSQGTSDQRNVSAEHFMDDAFKFLGYMGDMPDSSHDKGLLLAELFCEQRTLLVLDGLEPMQHPPGVLKGKLKDSALEVFIKQLAFNLDGLCVITSRVPVHELENRGEKHDLQSLSVEAGIEILTNFGVEGPRQDMENAVNEVHGHALTLSLLGGYLSEVCDGDIRKRDTIPNLADEPNEGDHAKHVMHSYQVWLEQTERFEDVNILFVIALFDRPVEMTTVNALLAGDAIAGITDKLKNIPVAKLKFAIGRLVKLQLISVGGDSSNSTLDCHPLVREHFANTLKAQNSLGYQQAHQRLYEYYKKLPDDELPNTLELMQPLFNAISHGCKAGLYQQALDEVYWPRILRESEAFINKKLGAFATGLACIANFFTDDTWAQPASELSEVWQAGMLNWAAFALRGLGRLHEALAPFVASIDFAVKQQNWKNAASAAGSASELCLTLGQVDKAIEYGSFCVEYADKSDDEFQQMSKPITYADALLQRGKPNDITQAQALFIEAEKRQQARQPYYPYLYSLRGYRYCQLLLKQALTAQSVNEVIERVETTLGWVKRGGTLLDIAADQLTLGKAYLRINELTLVQQYIDQAVSGLRKAGLFEFLLKGLLARANYHTQSNTTGIPKTTNHQAAWRDLDETFEIATFGDMRLHLCDYHIEACRNIAAQLAIHGEEYIVIENGQTICPTEDEMKKRMHEHFNTAKTMIDELKYHWRDDDLTDVGKLVDGLSLL